MPVHQISFYSGRFWTPDQENRLKYLTKSLTSTFRTNQAVALLSLCELDPDYLGQLLLLHESDAPGSIDRCLYTLFTNFPDIAAIATTRQPLPPRGPKITPSEEIVLTFAPESEEAILRRLQDKGLAPRG